MTETLTQKPLRPTRRKVLAAIPRKGRTTIQAIAKKAKVDQQAARRHADLLVASGLVEQQSFKATGKRGRPPKLYTRI